jgi:hypothetical protein
VETLSTEGRQYQITKHCQTTEEVRRMNKVMTSVVAFGVGMAAYNIAQRNNMMSGRQMKRMQRKVKRGLF